jgi:CubicO group peptidase (beta-lactamase class C family)
VSVDPPNFLPWTTPAYADVGFALLGLVISNITSKTYQQIFHESILMPLNMTSSNVLAPPQSEWHRAAINTTFIDPESVYDPSGGMTSTIADLARLGVGILTSTLMPVEQT